VPIEKRGDGERLAQLRRRMQPLLLRRTKEQVASDLPDKQSRCWSSTSTRSTRRCTKRICSGSGKKVLGLLDDMSKNRFEIFRSLTLLRQASLDVSLVDDAHVGVPSTKLDVLMEMLDDIVADGHRVLVFSQFTGSSRSPAIGSARRVSRTAISTGAPAIDRRSSRSSGTGTLPSS